MKHLGSDLTYGLRRLRSSPLFSIFATSSLALGIGATTAIYSVVHTALSPPTGIRDVAEIVNIAHYPSGSLPMMGISIPDFDDFRARQKLLRNVAAWAQVRQVVAANGQTYVSFGELVSGEYFSLLGVKPAAGRLLQSADDRLDAQPVVVLSYRVWQRLFGGSQDAIGASVKVNGHTFVVAGVAAREFKGQFNGGLIPTGAWLPLATAAMFPETGLSEDRGSRERRWLRVQGRLPAGVPFESMRAEMGAIAGQLDLESPIGDGNGKANARKSYRNSRLWTARRLVDLQMNESGAGGLANGLAMAVFGALFLVLLTACTNLTNLMLARVSARRQEFSVRLALGASRRRLMSESSTEALILAIAGGVGGLGLARVLVLTFRTEFDIGNGAKMFLDPRIDLPVLGVCAGATVLALLAAALVPAWMAARASVRSALAVGSSQSVGPRWWGRRMLIAGQVAVSVVLLAVMALFIGQLRAESRIDSGLDLDRIAVASLDFGMQGVDETRISQIVAAVLAELTHNPGVESVAASSGLPVGVMTPGAAVYIPGDRQTAVGAEYVVSTPAIFETLGVSIVSGRAFDNRETAASELVVVINETAARILFGRTAAVGQQITVQRRVWMGEDQQASRSLTVIGVASDSDSRAVGRRTDGVIYVPWAQQKEKRIVFSTRAKGNPADLVGDLRGAIARAAPDVGIAEIGTGSAVAGPPSLFAQVTAAVSGSLGSFGLLLALAGLTGVLSHIVARRTREIGVRLTLGATPGQIQRLILREGLSPVVLGVVAGAALAVIARLSLQPLFATLVPALDLVALGIVALLLLVAGTVAAMLPARRAASVDPNVALREL